MTGGRGTPSHKCLLSVMDQLPVTVRDQGFICSTISSHYLTISQMVMRNLSTHCRTSRCSRLYLPPFFKATLWMPSIALSIDCNTSSCSGAWGTERGGGELNEEMNKLNIHPHGIIIKL